MIITLKDINKAIQRLPDPKHSNSECCKIPVHKSHPMDLITIHDELDFANMSVETTTLIFRKQLFHSKNGILWLWVYTGDIVITNNI